MGYKVRLQWINKNEPNVVICIGLMYAYNFSDTSTTLLREKLQHPINYRHEPPLLKISRKVLIYLQR